MLSLVGSTAMLVSGHVRNNLVIGGVYAVVGVVVCAIAASYGGLWGVAVSRAALVAVEGIAYAAMTGRSVGVSGRDWIECLWRPALATAAMALALWFTGFGWTEPTGHTGLAEALRCIDTMLLGAGVYIAALLGCWAAAGYPEGAETFLIGLIPMGIGARARKLLVKT
jgi:hypothetical protein